MSKIKVCYILKSNNHISTIQSEGIIKNNRLIFKDNNIMFSIDLESKILKRTNDEYNLLLNFNDNKGICEVFKIGSIDIELETSKLNISDNNIYIKYILNNEIFELNLDYEVLE